MHNLRVIYDSPLSEWSFLQLGCFSFEGFFLFDVRGFGLLCTLTLSRYSPLTPTAPSCYDNQFLVCRRLLSGRVSYPEVRVFRVRTVTTLLSGFASQHMSSLSILDEGEHTLEVPCYLFCVVFLSDFRFLGLDGL